MISLTTKGVSELVGSDMLSNYRFSFATYDRSLKKPPSGALIEQRIKVRAKSEGDARRALVVSHNSNNRFVAFIRLID
jgi:hypothetical protein